MAQSLGSKIQAALVGILIALLVLAFAVWGINDVFSPNSKNAVLSLGGNEISTTEFDREFRRELSTLALTEGRQLPFPEAYARGIHRTVLQRMMTSKVIEIDADDLGIGVNTKSARAYVSEIDAFTDEFTGEFSEQKMMELLARQRPPLTRQQFEKNLIDDLRQQQTLPAINGGVVAPLEFAQQRYQYLTEQRKAEVLTFDHRAVATPPEPTKEELETFISENPIPFTAPEYRRITLIRIETSDVTPDLEIDDEELKEFFAYKVELGEIGSPETRTIAQISAPDEATAKKAAERLAKGENPDDVSALLSLVEPIIYEDALAEAVTDPITAEKAFVMKEGEAQAFEGLSWYAVVVTKVTPAVQPDLESIREELEADLLKSKAEEALFELTPKIENVLDEGGTLEDAAAAAEVPFSSIDFFDRSGTTQDERKLSGFEALPGIASDEEILKETFTNDVGYPTDLFETSTGGWAALRIDDVVDSTVRPFETVKEQAKVLWTTERTNEALDELMRALAARARDGETLTDIKASIENGAALENVILLRTNPGERLGPQVTVGLLGTSAGDISRGQGPKPLTRQVAKLTDIIENKDGLAGQYADLLQNQATAAIRSDLNIAYQSAVLAENPMKEFPEKIKSTLGLDAEE